MTFAKTLAKLVPFLNIKQTASKDFLDLFVLLM